MPRRHLGGNHDELVHDEGDVRDGDHARELFVRDADEDLRQALDDAALVDGDEDPDEEGAVAEAPACGEFFVELRVEVGEVFVDVAIQDEGEDWIHCVYGCVSDHEPILSLLLIYRPI